MHIKKKNIVIILLFSLLVLSSCEQPSQPEAQVPEPEVCEHEYSVDPDTLLQTVCVKCGEFSIEPHPDWPGSEDEYLILVNKEMHVDADYYPSDMVKIDRFVEGVGNNETHQLRAAAAEALNLMFDDAAKEGIELKLRTGFRSYSYQASLFNSYVNNHGVEEANKFSAKPGESEHQSGLAADLAGASQGFILSNSFGDTPEGKWVKDNCYKYGFILRYTDGSTSEVGPYTGYIYEAWHVRYIGIKAAEIMHRYPNWTLEQYLEEVARPGAWLPRSWQEKNRINY